MHEPPEMVRLEGTKTSYPREPEEEPRSRLKNLLFLALVAGLIPIAYTGWEAAVEFYRTVLERNSPLIKITELPRGFGIAPVRIQAEISDQGAGVDEVIVRVLQRGKITEVARIPGRKRDRVVINEEISAEKLKLEEGRADLVVQAFDRSFWFNQSEKLLSLQVDYRRPRVEVVSTQHNARRGGSQLVFYKAMDEDLAISGVRVGSRVFEGFPARGLDRSLDAPSLFVAVYAVGVESEVEPSLIKVFAEDRVGNGSSASFYNKVLDRKSRIQKIQLTEEGLRRDIAPIAESNASLAGKIGWEGAGSFQAPAGSEARLLEYFEFVSNPLQAYFERQLDAALKGPRFERQFQGSFILSDGVIQSRFGDTLSFQYEEKEVSKSIQKGFDIKIASSTSPVRALNDGLVAFSDNLGTLGRVVAVDHGLGLVSIYGRLGDVLVTRGEQVRKSQPIGTPGTVALSAHRGYHLQIRVHGIPVDPIEWADQGWFHTHVTEKMLDVKRALGLQSVIPLE